MINKRSIAALRQIEFELNLQLPERVFRSAKNALFQDGVRARREYAATLDGVFKVGGRRVANAFGVYTAGDDLESLRLGVFTRWPGAEIYEKGGVIRPKKRWLIFPVTARAYTSAGRIKRSWREANGRFKQSLFEGLIPIKVKGGILLVRETTASVRTSRSGRQSITVRKPGRAGGNTFEPVFLMIKQTRRRAVLRFFETFLRRGIRVEEVGRAIERGLSRPTA